MTEAKKTNGRGSDDPVDGNLAKVKKLMDKHRSRLSQKMNPFDLTVNFYVGTNFFFPLRKGVSFAQAFARLQQGLRRAMELIPELEGKVIACSEQEIGYKKGDLRITLPPLPSTATSDSDSTSSSTGPKQLVYKDVSQILPSFEELRDAGFISSALKDDLLLDGLPTPPSDVFNAQANFVRRRLYRRRQLPPHMCRWLWCRNCSQGLAESCRYVQGDTSATCSWLDPESLNRSLPYILYEQEGYARPAHEVDPATWGYVVFPPPKELGTGNGNGNGTAKAGALATKPVLPPSLTVPRDFFWQPAPDEGPRLRSTTFLIPPENVQKLRQEVIADPEIEGVITSINDIVQAFFWRAAIKGDTVWQRSAMEKYSDLTTCPFWSWPLMPPLLFFSIAVVNMGNMSFGTGPICPSGHSARPRLALDASHVSSARPPHASHRRLCTTSLRFCSLYLTTPCAIAPPWASPECTPRSPTCCYSRRARFRLVVSSSPMEDLLIPCDHK